MFIWTTRTILVFGKKVTWYRKTLPKKRKWGKVTFWDHSKNELIHQGYVLKSSPLLGSTPQGLLFLINRHFWKFQTCPFWKKCAFPHIWAFSDWRRRRRRRRPKNSAHLVRPLDHHVQGANIPFGNPSLRYKTWAIRKKWGKIDILIHNWTSKHMFH